MLIEKVGLILTIFLYNQKSMIMAAVHHEASQFCYNPNGRMGRCISINECQTIFTALHTLGEDSENFVRKSKCLNGGGGPRPYVCCTKDTRLIDHDQSKSQRPVLQRKPTKSAKHIESKFHGTHKVVLNGVVPKASLFPQPPKCGRSMVSNRIYGGVEAALGEFAWMANLVYRNANGVLVSDCAGNIINNRYILTAAHCIRVNGTRLKLVAVRIGDHNKQTEIDCNSVACLDPPQTLDIESVTVYENYGTSNYRRYPINDIALIRTNRNMKFSYSIEPICLPDFDMEPLRSDQMLTVAGWGKTEKGKSSNEKRKIDVPYVENNKCSLSVTDEQICAGGVLGEDSCYGDSGGPLMRHTSRGWFLEGIVANGIGCGHDHPAFYTRVRSFRQWIMDNVKP